MTARVSIVLPAYNEGPEIVDVLDRIIEGVELPHEILVIYDTPEDTTAPHVAAYAANNPSIRGIVNSYGPGPANAIRFGVDNAVAPVVVVTMADGSDDARQIDQLTRLVERGVVVACASRYIRGGQQVGGPWLKSKISRTAGRSLNLFARVGTNDPTNSFKAYSRDFVREVGIESDAGFEMGIEMVAKARRKGLPVAEIPTIWLDRAGGTSNFKVTEWIPRYLRWYFHAFGKREPGRPRPISIREQDEDGSSHIIHGRRIDFPVNKGVHAS
jgi:glycosyltransferase involved in cell wall biosynthesis